MEIKNILDALSMDDITEIIQLCTCTLNNKTIEFRLINDEFGVIDEIEYKNDDGQWTYEYINDNEDISLIIRAIENAPYEVFHKSDVGAILRLNHESIKEQNLPEHFKSEFYVDEEGPIIFKLEKNIIN